MVCAPRNLCARIPDQVSDEEAVFTVLGAIALQGVRLAQPTMGEFFAVIGLGLIGQLAVQLLLANGCQVLGLDLEEDKCVLASRMGAATVNLSQGEDPLAAARAFSRERGLDGVLITAATKSSDPIHQAAQMCRQRGRVIMLGVTGMELRRDDFYKKELTFQVSCSYGPGRYDSAYEEQGHDYPLGFVRWTEQRNFEAVLDLLATGKLQVKPLISHRFPFAAAEEAYRLITHRQEPYLGIVLNFHEGKPASERGEATESRSINLKPPVSGSKEPAVVGFLGAGNFTGQILLPALRRTGARLKTICSRGGVSGTHLGRKFGFEKSATAVAEILSDPDINTVFIATRHNTHASLVLAALQAGKHVFVEKPLCLKPEELAQIAQLYQSQWQQEKSPPLLMVGFNRRFAPHVVKIKECLAGVTEPKCMIITINAGYIPPEHWTQDPEVGGGRVIGEACHFVDLLRFLAGQPIKEAHASYLESSPVPAMSRDKVSFTLTFADGSIGTVHYFANGHKSFPKERVEVFGGGRVLQLDNFKVLLGYGFKNFQKMRLWRQDKGHGHELTAFIQAVRDGGPPPIPFAEILEVTGTTLKLAGFNNDDFPGAL
jgi:predicted dehydrogenase/NADPH:quinone reductase-like Zn-dependent oxidoreductase